MEPSAAPLDTTPDPAIVQPPGANAPGAPREQPQEQLRIGESGQFSEGLEDRAVSVMRYSASSFGFAFDATLDVLSSAIVLWRYSNAAAVHSAHREYMACVILGVIFLLSSICIVIKAIHDLAKRVLPEVDDFLYSVSVLSGILCTVLAVIKFMLGKVLTSRALITDGFNSLVGGIMGFSILLSAEVFKHNSSVWYLDGSIGVLIGLTISAYGIKLLIDMVPRVRQTRHYEMFE
ncbi:transmembrane protein 163 isoform X2 [Parus major]|uniref:transmembrane protein 163 isoform X2 n=1 Tax=Parus major TaxID=9157 RepID=UPI00077103D6|nr:transmembrane protein 163 isoform X2 [Parus major]XP_058695331.1 transmembrane protein 163 isoform X2 [Poecile atricapillus]